MYSQQESNKPKYKYVDYKYKYPENSNKPSTEESDKPKYTKINLGYNPVDDNESKSKFYLIKSGKQIELTDEYIEERRLEEEKVFKERVEKAITEQEICCITHDVLTKDNITVTKCGHVMSIDGALSIMERKTNECPICRGYLIM